MKSIKFLSFSLIISTWVFVGMCQGGGGGGDDPISSFPCIAKLIPCQPYLGKSSESPPDSCCLPLKALIASPNDTKCLCTLLDNPIIMKSFNVTKDDAFKLATACGSKSGDSLCKTALSPTPSRLAPPSNGSSSGNTSTTTASSPSNKSAAAMAKHHSCYLVFNLVVLPLVSGRFMY